MLARLFEDSQKGPGHAYIEVVGVDLKVDPMKMSFILKSNSRKQSLSPKGWQGADCRLSPSAADLQEGMVRIFIGPDLVNHLEQQDSYLLTLVYPDGNETSGSLTIQSITYSDISDRVRFDPAPGSSPEADKQIPNDAPSNEGKDPVEPPKVLETPATEKKTDPPQNDLPPSVEPKAKLPRAMIAGGIVLLLLLAGGGYFYFGRVKIADLPAREPKPPLTEAREHITAGGEPGKSFEMANRMMNQPSGADAAFLLFEDAAQKGHAEAMVRLGRFYDPLDAAPTGSITKDPVQAYEWYHNALKAGRPEAESKLRDLRGWVEKAAASGSGEAQELITRWK